MRGISEISDIKAILRTNSGRNIRVSMLLKECNLVNNYTVKEYDYIERNDLGTIEIYGIENKLILPIDDAEEVHIRKNNTSNIVLLVLDFGIYTVSLAVS